MKACSFALVLTLCLSAFSAFGQSSPSQEPGESFASFFARITRGGTFPGIYVEPPAPVQAAFLKTIQIGFWVGRRDQVMKKLKSQGIDVWNDWYKTNDSFAVIFNSPEKKLQFQKTLESEIQKDQSECKPQCPTAADILKSQWSRLNAFSRQEFLRAFVVSNPAFGGHTLLESLSDIYQFPADKVRNSTQIKILSHSQFVEAVHQLGYQGEVYFRGLTAPDPQNPDGHIIVLDTEMLSQGSPFENDLLKTFEQVGILVHELSHVFQDLKGKSLGWDVQVRSAEAALILEGSAEFLAERAMTKAALTETSPSALELFVSEQAIEIVAREGNGSSGRLFPYTVGLPFAAALDQVTSEPNKNQLIEKTLEFLGKTDSFQSWVSQDFFQTPH